MKCEKFDDAFEIIKSARHLIAFTGAGISTLSGIPDFRGSNLDIWKKYQQSKVFDIEYFLKEPRYFYDFAREAVFTMLDATPNITHNTLTELERVGQLKSIITQNIDTLHQKSGAKKVLEMHGSPMISRCLDCAREYSITEMKDKIKNESVPRCVECSGLIKPKIIFYGEQLESYTINESFKEAAKSDVCLVFGSSLVVYPAAAIPETVLRYGGKIIIVNRQPTHLDRFAIFKSDDLQEFCVGLLDFWGF